MSAGKKERPALADVELSDLPEPISRADPQEVERRHAFAASLESSDFLPRSASAGLVKVVRSEPPPRAPEPGGRKLRSEEPNLTVRLPEYVQQAVRLRAVVDKTTVRLVILRALQQAGFEIRAEDMTDDRGIVAKMRRRGGVLPS